MIGPIGQSQETETITVRLDRLERENRLQRRALLCLGAALVGITAFGTPLVRTPEVLTARKIVLQDDRGRTRAVLGHDGEGAAQLTFQDEQGKDQVLLGAGAKHASRLEFRDGNSTRTSLWSSSTGTSALSFFDPEELGATSLYLRHDQDMGLSLRQGDRRSELAMHPDGTVSFDGPQPASISTSQERTRPITPSRRWLRPMPTESGNPTSTSRTLSARPAGGIVPTSLGRVHLQP